MSETFGSISHEAKRVGELQQKISSLNTTLQHYSFLNDMMLDLASGQLHQVSVTIEVKTNHYGRRELEINSNAMKSRALEIYGDIIKIRMQSAHEDIMMAAKELSGAEQQEKDGIPTDE